MPSLKLYIALGFCILGLSADSSWVQRSQLFANDASAYDYFGSRVAIDGDTIVVGAPYDDTAAGDDAGSVYVFVRSGGTWSQQDHLFAYDAAAGDGFGLSVRISGDTIIVGARLDDTGAGADAGSAYVFTRNGGTWSHQDHLFANDAMAYDHFGDSVAIDGDSVVISANQDDTAAGADAGSVYVFARSGGTWSQQDHLFASDAAAGDRFGDSVAISGDTVVIGARLDDTSAGASAGSAYVFTQSASTWSQQARLFASDAALGDEFGYSVAIDGGTIAVGASHDDTAAGTNAGSGYVFVGSGDTWTQQDHLFASDAAENDEFGIPMALYGDTIVVGADSDETAAGDDAGSAYLFTRSGGTWSQQQHLFAGDAAAGDQFGWSVAIDGDTIVVSANLNDVAGEEDAGSTYVFGPSFVRIFIGDPDSLSSR